MGSAIESFYREYAERITRMSRVSMGDIGDADVAHAVRPVSRTRLWSEEQRLDVGHHRPSIRRHWSIDTSAAFSTPRLVTICGPSVRLASRNSLKRSLASCTGHVLRHADFGEVTVGLETPVWWDQRRFPGSD